MTVLRFASLADHPEAVPLLAAWHHAEWAPIIRDWPLALAEAELAAQQRRGTIPSTLIAFEQERLVGSASLLDEDMPDFPAFTPWLASVFVVPDRRGAGIGTALVHQTLADARGLGAARLYLYTTEAEGWYAARGWRVVERRAARGTPGVIMSYDLAPE
ncbi:MAG: GNAT family N-acetyltransferase [Gemmatimonadetes bacterium]|nr:GNAT family N-acetyltransferase [Gemmatimonadota bacterium]MBK7348408.1 GNAT family N-acetyltransferase [Gemmatimonadota bacterium]MBK7783033.1 GNAT family N-acetyltransferase [Gemmatimonadota bacterium]